METQEERLGADYDEVYRVPAEQVEDHVRNAEQFLRLAEEMIRAPEVQ